METLILNLHVTKLDTWVDMTNSLSSENVSVMFR